VLPAPHAPKPRTRSLLVTGFLVALLAVVAALAPAASTDAKLFGKKIVVSIGQQAMWAYKGDKVVISSLVSTGRAGFDTPLGNYAILSKLESQTMEGVIGGEYYNVPDVPWVMYFTNSGHALHGTYWHNNFGTPMSHGCVNLPMDVAAWLFQWAPVGTPVLIVP
jgi:lipoprotein-anchoring transpeptidase ErfK/SrfK